MLELFTEIFTPEIVGSIVVQVNLISLISFDLLEPISESCEKCLLYRVRN